MKTATAIIEYLELACGLRDDLTGPAVDAARAALDTLTENANNTELDALVTLIRAAEVRSARLGFNTSYSIDEQNAKYGFDHGIVDMLYTANRKQWASRTDAAIELTEEINAIRKDRRARANPGDINEHLCPLTTTELLDGSKYSETVMDWLKQADQRDGHKWPRGGNRRA